MHKNMLDKTKNIAISIFRYVIIFGIAFYIIYPLIQKTLYAERELCISSDIAQHIIDG